VGRSVERALRFANHSAVEANFSVALEGGDAGEVSPFTITPTRWGVQHTWLCVCVCLCFCECGVCVCVCMCGCACACACACVCMCVCACVRVYTAMDAAPSPPELLQPTHRHVRACRGRLGPEEYSEMRVCFAPRSAGVFTCQNVVVSTAGGNRVVLNVSGQAAGPLVTLSTR